MHTRLVLVTTAMLLALTACGSSTSGGPGTPSKNRPSTKAPDQSAPKTPPAQTTPAPNPAQASHPQVTGVIFKSEDTQRTYASGAAGVDRDVAVTANIYLPTQGVGVKESTLDGNVKLYETSTGKKFDGFAGTDGAGGNITFTPKDVLSSNTKYTFEVTSGVKDEKGVSFVPFKATFTTGQLAPLRPLVSFNEKTVYSGGVPMASLRVGPDGKLYASTLTGQIMRWTIGDGGALTDLQTLSLPELQGRAIVGLTFDPASGQNGAPLVLWISNNAPLPFGPTQPADFSGKISRITLSADPAAFSGTLQDYVVGLPRSIKDHMTNSLAFGPDGALYVTQGANSSTGAPDPTWVRGEHRLSAAVLRVDPSFDVSAGPIDVQTELLDGSTSPGTYDPDAPGAPVTVFADGVRNAYDLVWHSNGFLYLPTNGGAAGGSTPASPDGAVPALTNVSNQNDYLFKTSLAPDDRAAYFGHPVALRGHYVLNGGNPTDAPDVAEVVPDAGGRNGYPVGVQPDSHYRPPAYNFGANRSPDGALEYKSDTFGGLLRNRLLVVEYSNGKDIVALQLGADGNVSDARRIGTTLTGGVKRFTDPIDLAEDGRNGNLYVAELSPTPRITLLTP